MNIHLKVIVAYGVLTIAMTLPAVFNLTTHVVGSGGDPWQTMWRFEDRARQVSAAISSGTVPSLLHHHFGGGGEPRLVNNSVWPWMDLQWLVGQPLTYNLVWLLSFILSGYFMFLLVRWLIRNYRLSARHPELAAFAAGVVYAYAPYHVAHSSGHFGALQTQWLPLALLATFAFVKRPSLSLAVGLSVVLMVQSWTEHHYLLWYALFAVVYIILERKAVGQLVRNVKQIPVVGSLLILTAVLVILPWWPTMQLSRVSSNVIALGQEQAIRFSSDLFSFILPALFHPVWGALVGIFAAEKFTGNIAEATHFLGWIPLLLVIFFAHRLPRHVLTLWLTVATLFFIVSLGPRLHVLGQVLPVPLPWALVDQLPVFEAVRTVGRASVMVVLSISVLFGLVLATQLTRRQIGYGLGLLILVEFLFLPVPLQAFDLPRIYEVLATKEGSRVLEIPATTNYTAASRALYASGRHGKEVVGSIALERATGSDPNSEAKSLPAVRQLLHLKTTDLRELRTDFFNQSFVETLPEAMAWLDASVILVHEDSLSKLQRATVDRFLTQNVMMMREEVEDTTLYTLPRETTVPSDGVFIARDGNWNVTRDENGIVKASVNGEAELTIYNIDSVQKTVRLEWDNETLTNTLFLRDQDGSLISISPDEQGLSSLIVPVAPGASQFTFVDTEAAVLLVQPRMEIVE